MAWQKRRTTKLQGDRRLPGPRTKWRTTCATCHAASRWQGALLARGEAVDSTTLFCLLAQSILEQEEGRKVAEEKEKVLKAKQEDGEEDRCVQDVDGACNTFHWHRRSRRSVWHLPTGVFVKGTERRRINKKKSRIRRRMRTRRRTLFARSVRT